MIGDSRVPISPVLEVVGLKVGLRLVASYQMAEATVNPNVTKPGIFVSSLAVQHTLR